MTARVEVTEHAGMLVTYDGEAAYRGRMDARLLAPAMYSTALAIEHTAGLVHGPTVALRIDINADFRHGSFAYELLTSPVAQNLAAGLWAGAHLTWPQLREVVGYVREAIAFRRWLQNRRVENAEPTTASGSIIRVTAQDNAHTEINVHTWNVSQNPTVGEDINGAVKPLEHTGIERVSFDTQDGNVVEVTRDEAEYFAEVPGELEVVHESTGEMFLVIASPSLDDPRHKWRFARADGTPLWATILDPGFVKRVYQAGEPFRVGDSLIAEVKTVVSQNKVTGKPKAEHEVVRVKRHLQPPHQQNLFPEP